MKTLKTRSDLRELIGGEIVPVRPYLNLRKSKRNMIYCGMDNIGYLHFIEQDTVNGSFYQQSILEWHVQFPAIYNGAIQFLSVYGFQQFHPRQKGHEERKEILEEKGLWVPPKETIVTELIKKTGIIPYPKKFSNNIPPLTQMLYAHP